MGPAVCKANAPPHYAMVSGPLISCLLTHSSQLLQHPHFRTPYLMQIPKVRKDLAILPLTLSYQGADWGGVETRSPKCLQSSSCC